MGDINTFSGGQSPWAPLLVFSLAVSHTYFVSCKKIIIIIINRVLPSFFPPYFFCFLTSSP